MQLFNRTKEIDRQIDDFFQHRRAISPYTASAAREWLMTFKRITNASNVLLITEEHNRIFEDWLYKTLNSSYMRSEAIKFIKQFKKHYKVK